MFLHTELIDWFRYCTTSSLPMKLLSTLLVVARIWPFQSEIREVSGVEADFPALLLPATENQVTVIHVGWKLIHHMSWVHGTFRPRGNQAEVKLRFARKSYKYVSYPGKRCTHTIYQLIIMRINPFSDHFCSYPASIATN